MQIIKHSENCHAVTFRRNFDYEGHVNWGFSFDCDGAGNRVQPVNSNYQNPEADRNFAACLTGEVNGRKVVDRGIERSEQRWRSRAVGKCETCGAHVTLSGFTNSCDCGADYNMSGQRLADRSQWGEETSENISDILSADTDPWGGDSY